MKLTKSLVAQALAIAVLASCISQSKAISITVNSVTNNSTTPFAVNTSGIVGHQSSRQGNSSAAVVGSATETAPEAVSSSVAVATRYASIVSADAELLGSSTANSGTFTSNYTVVVTVSSAMNYEVLFSTSILGALTAIDDFGGFALNGSASISNVAGTLNAIGDPNLDLASSTSRGGTGATGGDQVVVSANNALLLTGQAGVNVYTLQFSWTQSASSPAGGGDEMAVRLGLAGTVNDTGADDYPGVGARVQANDGHFLTVAATIVPESGTFALAGLGLLGLVGMAIRRRRG